MQNSELTIKKGYKQTDVGIIPEDWEVSTVGREFEIQLGKRLDEENNVGILKPYVPNKSVQWNEIDIEELPLVPLTSLDLKRLRLRQDDLLVCEGGEAGRAAIWNCPIEECYFQNTLHRLRPLRNYNSKLFLELLRSWTSHNMLANYISQTSIAHLTREKFAEVPLPVPPLPEQQAIAEVLSDVDALITSLDALLTKKRNIKQGTMQLLLTGKKRLVAETKKGYKQTEIGIIPEDWKVMTYGNIFSFLSTATNSRADLSDYEEVLYVHYGDIHTKVENFLDPNKLQLPTIEMSKAKKHSFVANGDLLMADASEDYEGICKSVEVKNLEDKKAISGLHTFLLRDNNKVFVDGFRGYISSNKIVKNQFDKLATGLKVYGVSKTNLKLVSIPVPPHEEQKAIAQILSDMDAEIEALETQRDKYKAVKQGMMQELLTGKTRLI